MNPNATIELSTLTRVKKKFEAPCPNEFVQAGNTEARPVRHGGNKYKIVKSKKWNSPMNEHRLTDTAKQWRYVSPTFHYSIPPKL